MDNHVIIKDDAAPKDGTGKPYCGGPIQKTRVVVNEVLPNGKKIFRECGENKVIAGGGGFHAFKDFNFGTVGPTYEPDPNAFVPHPKIPTYDSIMAGLSRGFYVPETATPVPGGEAERKIYIFAIGLDGCGLENSRKFVVRKDNWISPTGPVPTGETPEGDPSISSCLIPFRYYEAELDSENKPTNMLTGEEGLKYFGCAVETDEDDNKFLAYYFKAFDAPPVLSYKYGDGFNLDDLDLDDAPYPSVYGKPGARGINVDLECIVELSLSVSASDAKEWFDAIGKTSECRVNTISLCSAVPYKDGSNWYFKEITPITKYNMSNKSLSDANSGLQISYYLYY